MSRYVSINGKLLASDPGGLMPDNRAYRYGYGLFETMLMRDGVIRLAQYHWDRLFDGMTLLKIKAPPFFKEELERELFRTVRKNSLEGLSRVRLQIYAGAGGIYDGDDFNPGFTIETFPLESSVLMLNELGLIMGISDIVKHTGTYANLKSSSALPYAIAARQARSALWNDALLRNEHGRVTDSSIANLFWIKERRIFTPPLSEGCIAGVMRKHLLILLPTFGYEVTEQEVHPESLQKADEIFLTNAIRGIRWVKEIAGKSFYMDDAHNIHNLAIREM